jgi:diaminopimelate epimerase
MIPFIKMQGLGNDFVVIDDLGRPPGLAHAVDAGLARRICDRRFGVGADQVLWIRNPQARGADARMEILNADGSTAEMCGNGIRAVALHLFRNGPAPGRARYAIETLAGLLAVEVHGDRVRVDMGVPRVGPAAGETLAVDGRTLRFVEVNVGNPHAVFFVDDVAAVALERLGPLVENHARFAPARTNVEFVEVTGRGSIRVRVWERGAGVTLACGTGACASAVAALATGRAHGRLTVGLPGGDLLIGWEGEGKPVLMEGPAEEVFRGEFAG